MFSDPALNYLVFSFKLALDHYDNPLYRHQMLQHLAGMNLSILESKTVYDKKALIDYLCHVTQFHHHPYFSDMLGALMEAIIQKFYQEDSKMDPIFLQRIGIVSIPFIFDLLSQTKISIAHKVLNAYTTILSSYPELNKMFIKQFFLSMTDLRQLDFNEDYLLFNRRELNAFMSELLSLVYPSGAIFYSHRVFNLLRPEEFKAFFYFELYFNLTLNRENLLTFLIEQQHFHLINQHIDFIHQSIVKHPVFAHDLKRRILQLMANQNIAFHKNHQEFYFLNQIFKKIVSTLYSNPNEFEELITSFLGQKSILEKLFFEQTEYYYRETLLQTYAFLLHHQNLSSLSAEQHIGDGHLNLVDFMLSKNPNSLEFCQYLKWISLLWNFEIISQDEVHKNLFSSTKSTFLHLIRQTDTRYLSTFFNYLSFHHKKLFQDQTEVNAMRQHLLIHKPLLHAYKQHSLALINEFIQFYAQFFSSQELGMIMFYYRNIVELKMQESLIFTTYEDDTVLETKLDLSFLEQDDLDILDQEIDAFDPHFSIHEEAQGPEQSLTPYSLFVQSQPVVRFRPLDFPAEGPSC